MDYNFEWDPAKARKNLAKHKVDFDRAAQVFLDPYMLSIVDEEHSESENRWITIGRDSTAVLLVVIHTFQEIDTETLSVRIISVRKATRKESRQYSSR